MTYLERPTSFKDEIIDMLASEEKDGSAPADAFAVFGNPQLKLMQALADFRSILAGPSIQVRCLECPSSAPARVQQQDVSTFAALKAWLL